MNPTFGDLAPALVGIVAAIVGLISLWLAVRQAHAPDKRRRGEEPRASE